MRQPRRTGGRAWPSSPSSLYTASCSPPGQPTFLICNIVSACASENSESLCWELPLVRSLQWLRRAASCRKLGSRRWYAWPSSAIASRALHRAHRFVRHVLCRVPPVGLLSGDARCVHEHPGNRGRAVLAACTDARLPWVVEYRRSCRGGHRRGCGGLGNLPEQATARPVGSMPPVVSWLSTRMTPTGERAANPHLRRARQTNAVACFSGLSLCLGASLSPTWLCEGAAADWAAVYLRNSLHAVPLVAGLAYADYALAMLAIRLSGNRLFTRFTAHRLLPLLATVATLGSPPASSSPVERPRSSGLRCSAPDSEE